MPFGQEDRGDQVMAGEVPVEEGDPVREQFRPLPREVLQQGLLPAGGLPDGGGEDRAAGAGGQRDDPGLRDGKDPSPVPVVPK